GEALVGLGAHEQSAVDEEGRRARQPEALTLLDALLDLGRVLARVEARPERRRIEAEVRRMLLEVGHAELGLVGEELVVHRPELALVVRARARLRGLLGVGVDLRQGEVAEDDADLARILLLDLLERDDGPRAIRALVVGVLDDRDGRGLGALGGTADGVDLRARGLQHHLHRRRLPKRGHIIGAPRVDPLLAQADLDLLQGVGLYRLAEAGLVLIVESLRLRFRDRRRLPLYLDAVQLVEADAPRLGFRLEEPLGDDVVEELLPELVFLGVDREQARAARGLQL